MASKNCSIAAPELFRGLMHYSHFVSYPLYLVTLIILFRESSKLFQTYKYFIIVHIFINIASETYVSFFMLPVSYLPLPIFRFTGWLSGWGFSGLMQFYIFAQLTMFTVGSILEMFYYRLRVTVVLQTSSFFPKLAKYQLNVYRFFGIVHPIVTTVTFGPSVSAQVENAMKMHVKHPTFPPEITCYSIVSPVYDNVVLYVVLAIYNIHMLISVTGSVGPLVFIIKFIKKGFALSKETMKLQRILIISLFIQGAVHGTFIIIPTFFLMYAIIFEMHEDEMSQILLLSVAYHGFLSTCAMIIFTKPLRDKLFFWTRWTNRTAQEPLQDSGNRFSTSLPN